MKMDPYRRERRIKKLWALILLGGAYSSFLYYQDTFADPSGVQGIIGVLLGLYICSHPAAHVVDLFFLRGGGQRLFSSKRAVVMWLALNVLALLIGWTVIFFGTTRLIGRGS